MPGSHLKKGDRVIVFQGVSCGGHCHACRNGLSPTHCVANIHPKPGITRVGMAGIGFIAMGHVISAMFRNATVIALIRNKYRQGVLEKMGVEHFIDPSDEHWLEKVKDLTYEHPGDSHSPTIDRGISGNLLA